MDWYNTVSSTLHLQGKESEFLTEAYNILHKISDKLMHAYCTLSQDCIFKMSEIMFHLKFFTILYLIFVLTCYSSVILFIVI